MNWITTNIRLPEDVYIELKLKAAQTRKSVAELIREKITAQNTDSSADSLLRELDELGHEMNKKTKGKNATTTLIKNRYMHI